MKKGRREDFDVWWDKFIPIESEKETILYEIDDERIKNAHWETVWTLMSGDNSNLYIVPGWHFVNRMNYFITENKWNDKTRDYKY